MSYIIVWRNSHREPHLELGAHDFLETFPTYEDAKEAAEEAVEDLASRVEEVRFFHDYKIYQEAES